MTSDHAPYRMDDTGKFAHGFDAPFNRIANGMPGLETRLPLMFDAMVGAGRATVEDFVDLTASAPAKAFGLTGKGQIVEGFDADIAIWDPQRRHTYGSDDLHDNVGYNPFEGHSVTGWPVQVLSNGRSIMEDGTSLATPGQGRRIPMAL